MKITITLDSGKQINLTELADALEPYINNNEVEDYAITPFVDHDSDTIDLCITRINGKGL